MLVPQRIFRVSRNFFCLRLLNSVSFLPSSPCQRNHSEDDCSSYCKNRGTKTRIWVRLSADTKWLLFRQALLSFTFPHERPVHLTLTISDLPLYSLHSLHSIHKSGRLSPRRVRMLTYCSPDHLARGLSQHLLSESKCFRVTAEFCAAELPLGSFKKWSRRVTRVYLKSHRVRSLTQHRQIAALPVQGGKIQFSEVFLNFAAVKGRKSFTKIISFKLCPHSVTNAKCTAPCFGKTNPELYRYKWLCFKLASWIADSSFYSWEKTMAIFLFNK